MTHPILQAREERWAKKLALVKALALRRPDEPASLAVLTLRMPASLRASGRSSAKALSLHSSFVGELREQGIVILHEEFRVGDDGPESYIGAAIEPTALKRMAVEWETRHPWGELADLDVMDSSGNPVVRQELGFPPRTCLVCGEAAVVCSAGRSHEPALVETRVEEIWGRPKKAEAGEDSLIGRLALKAALFEAAAWPKPGLVDPVSRGAHGDMDYFTFISSAIALEPWFTEFARLGRLHRGEPADLFPPLREAGKAAERDMFRATGGVNTHKGLIFSLGLLCAAAGRLAAAGAIPDPRTCAGYAAAIVGGITLRDFGETASGAVSGSATGSVGQRLYISEGVRGIRGEAEDGFPSVIGHALPRLRADLSAGLEWNDAMIDALLVLCTVVEDTNVLGRAGREGLAFLRREADHALGLGAMATADGRAAARAMDASLTGRNISPGGCADLLALTVFLEMLASAAWNHPSGENKQSGGEA